MFIDTHCHLSSSEYEDIDKVINENRKNGIDKIIISACTKDTFSESLEFTKKYEEVYACFGFHPSEVNFISDRDLLDLKELVMNSDKVVAIGEIGLDYHYGKDNRELQKKWFRCQLKLACELNLPVVIHTRDATEDTIKILEEFKIKGVIHCFNGSVETAKTYIGMGYKLGIGGVVTFKNSKLPDIVKKIGINNIVLETDSPYLTPEPFRGKKNSSMYIPQIAKKISEVCSIDYDKVAYITTENALLIFDLHWFLCYSNNDNGVDILKKFHWLKITFVSILVLLITLLFIIIFIKENESSHVVKMDSDVVCSIENKVPISDLAGLSLDINEIDEGIVGEVQFEIETVSDDHKSFNYEIYLIEENDDMRISGNYVKICLFDEQGNILNSVNKNDIPTFSSLKVSSSYAYAKRVYLGKTSGNGVKKFRMRIWLSDSYFSGLESRSFSVRLGVRVIK